MKYKFTNEMEEISGVGGEYEKGCRDMVVAGMKWLDKHPNADISYKVYKNIYGLTADETDDCKEMEKAMLAVNKGCSGAQMQACKGHITFIKANGWDKYVEEMTKKGEEKEK